MEQKEMIMKKYQTYLVMIVTLLISTSLHAKVFLDGFNTDRAAFVKMLNDNTLGDAIWREDIADGSLYLETDLQLSQLSTNLNFFAYNLFSNVVSMPGKNITLEIGNNIPSVLFGSFYPQNGDAVSTGIQRLDMADLNKLPLIGNNTKTQASIITHEILEVHGSVINNAPFSMAHAAAIDMENFVYGSQGATGVREEIFGESVFCDFLVDCELFFPWLNDPNITEAVVTVDSVTGEALFVSSICETGDICHLYTPWYDYANPEVTYIDVTIDGANTILDISSGMFNTGFDYNGSEKDINFSDISVLDANYAVVSSVPVPAAAWLFGSGLIGLVCVARRKKA